MRKLLISAAAIALFTLSAGAQPDHDRGPGGGGPAPEAPHGGPAGGGRPDHGGGAPHPQPGANPAFSRGPNGGGFNRPAAPANPAYTRGPNGGGDFRQGGANMAGRPGGNFDHGRPGGNFDRGGQGFNRGGANGRHDFHGFGDFHQNFNAPRHFHVGGYRRPPGWYPHRWSFGEFLPAAFWARDYWLTDYMDYALPPPPFGAIWVRVGDDALLIDQDTGEIITVEYGVFY